MNTEWSQILQNEQNTFNANDRHWWSRFYWGLSLGPIDMIYCIQRDWLLIKTNETITWLKFLQKKYVVDVTAWGIYENLRQIQKSTGNVFVLNSAILTQILTFLFDLTDEMGSVKWGITMSENIVGNIKARAIHLRFPRSLTIPWNPCFQNRTIHPVKFMQKALETGSE